MLIIEDTREQKPLRFDLSWKELEGVVEECLNKEGDYAVRFSDGVVPPVRIERKASDLYSSLTSDYERFSKELKNCISKGIKLYIFIEKPESKLDDYCKYTKGGKTYKLRWQGEDLLERLNTLEDKYGIHYKCFMNREEMAKAIYRKFYSYGKLHVKAVREKKREERKLKKKK
jgi:hypothetical protein